MPIRRAEEQKRAWAELTLLAASRALPPDLDGATIAPATRVFDLNGEELFLRTPLGKQGGVGFADIGTHPALGAVLLAVSAGVRWHESRILAEARKAAGKRIAAKADKVRFVAYSFPKVAVQFLAKGEELALLELWTWKHVPPRSDRSPQQEPPSNFERWSFLEEQSPADRKRATAQYRKRAAGIDELIARAKRVPFDLISAERLRTLLARDVALLLNESRELHYTTRNADHVPCYEVRGQQTNVWCVAASVQMLLDFYRYEYTQVRLAAELGLGTVANPNGLPYSRDGDTVTVIERMTANALDAAMNVSPTWTEFRSEILANRPLVSFVPGHARTVAGYTRSGLNGLGLTPFRGLLVYDPWPPNAGVITRWENFDSTTYRRTFTARVTLV